MEAEINKFSTISEIYPLFTEKNKENLLKTAKGLLKIQKEDAETLANSLPSPFAGKKQGLA